MKNTDRSSLTNCDHVYMRGEWIEFGVVETFSSLNTALESL